MNSNADDMIPAGSDSERKNLLSHLNNELLNDEEIVVPGDEELFEADAAEGLAGFKGSNVSEMVEQLNSNLHTQLKKKKRKKRPLPDQTMTYVIIFTLLLLIIISFMLIKMMSP